jgi:Zn-dependent alcohol dehydrogenase
MSITRRKFVEAASLGVAFGSILPTTPFAGRAQGAEDAGRAGHKAKIIDLDDRVGFAQQLELDAAPVVWRRTGLGLSPNTKVRAVRREDRIARLRLPVRPQIAGHLDGGRSFQVDMPCLLSLWRQGRLKLDYLSRKARWSLC